MRLDVAEAAIFVVVRDDAGDFRVGCREPSSFVVRWKLHFLPSGAMENPIIGLKPPGLEKTKVTIIGSVVPDITPKYTDGPSSAAWVGRSAIAIRLTRVIRAKQLTIRQGRRREKAMFGYPKFFASFPIKHKSASFHPRDEARSPQNYLLPKTFWGVRGLPKSVF